MGASIGNGALGMSAGTGPRSPLAVASSAAGSTVIIQNAAWITGDTGVSVYEKSRLGRQQREHPSPPVTPPSNSIQPYGFSKRPASSGATSSSSSSSSDFSKRRTAERIAHERGRAGIAPNDKSRSDMTAHVQMATVHGDMLHKLMETKKNVALALGGSASRARVAR